MTAGLQSLLSKVLALAGCRAELLGLEARELQLRWFGSLLLGGAALVALLLALQAMLLLVFVLLPFQWRAALLGALALLFAGTALALLYGLKRRLDNGPAAFELTRNELKKDWQALVQKEPS
jgi:uncharacterized membrane protein YqjE